MDTRWKGALTLTGWPLALALLVLLVVLRDGVCPPAALAVPWGLTWRQAIETTVLWEFASAITPGIVGGGAVAIWGSIGRA